MRPKILFRLSFLGHTSLYQTHQEIWMGVSGMSEDTSWILDWQGPDRWLVW